MKLKQNLDYENNSSVAKNIAHRIFYLNEDVPVLQRLQREVGRFTNIYRKDRLSNLNIISMKPGV